jgi:hypothetical protein
MLSNNTKLRKSSYMVKRWRKNDSQECALITMVHWEVLTSFIITTRDNEKYESVFVENLVMSKCLSW